MCRSIHVLHNFEPPATDEEVRAAALQYVRKIAGTTKPAKDNEAVFAAAVDAVEAATRALLDGLVAHTSPKDRAEEAAKARAKWEARATRA